MGSPTAIVSTPQLKSTNKCLPMSPIVYANIDFPVDEPTTTRTPLVHTVQSHNASIIGRSPGASASAPTAPPNDSVVSNESIAAAKYGCPRAPTPPPSSTEAHPTTVTHPAVTPLTHDDNSQPGSSTTAFAKGGLPVVSNTSLFAQRADAQTPGAGARSLRLIYTDLDLLERLSGGATGQVHRALHAPSGKQLAVKIMDLSPVVETDAARRLAGFDDACDGATDASDDALERQLWAQGSFGHFAEQPGCERIEQLQAAVVRELRVLHSHYRCPHVTKMYDAFYDHDQRTIAIVMEFMSYGSLERLGRMLDPTGGNRRMPLPERILAVVAEQVLLGLHDMHSRGHIHRDVKPTNILVSATGAVKLADFGLCEQLLVGHENTDDGEHCSGTNHFMSPERLRGEAHGGASDVWALGLTLAECACGHYPIDLSGCRDEFEMMDRMSQPIKFPARVAHQLTDCFKHFVQRAMLPDPKQRPTAEELLEDPFLSQWRGNFDFAEYLEECVRASSRKRHEARDQAKVARAKVEHFEREWECDYSVDASSSHSGSPNVGSPASQGRSLRRGSRAESSPGHSRHGSVSSPTTTADLSRPDDVAQLAAEIEASERERRRLEERERQQLADTAEPNGSSPAVSPPAPLPAAMDRSRGRKLHKKLQQSDRKQKWQHRQ
jgi:serine/threonine protein kinase